VGADLSGLEFGELSDVSALLSLPLFALYGLASLVLAGGAAALRRHGAEAAALLAGGAANALGGAYAAAAPMFGALGGGLTGSNVGSNALFMPLQVEAAAGTGSSVALIAGIQNVAGSHASFLSPQRLVLAATATGLVGREGEIAKAAVAPVAVVLLLLAAVGVVASSSGG